MSNSTGGRGNWDWGQEGGGGPEHDGERERERGLSSGGLAVVVVYTIVAGAVSVRYQAVRRGH